MEGSILYKGLTLEIVTGLKKFFKFQKNILN